MTTPANPDDLLAFVHQQFENQRFRAEGLKTLAYALPAETGAYLTETADLLLADVDAKRRILDRHRPHLLKAQTFRPAMLQCEHCADLCHSRSGLGCDEPIDAPWPCPDVCDMASVYADHPGYREEWRP